MFTHSAYTVLVEHSEAICMHKYQEFQNVNNNGTKKRFYVKLPDSAYAT
jgi:hypothetical protein